MISIESWERQLFGGDNVTDIKAEYKILLSYGVDSKIATEKMKAAFLDEYISSGEEDVFWLTIAYINWKYGVDDEAIRYTALRCLDSHYCLSTWEFENEAIASCRIEALNKFKKSLSTLRNPYMKPPKPMLSLRRKTKLQKGDVIAYQLGSAFQESVALKYSFASKPYLYKKWVLLRVIDIHSKAVSSIMPELDCNTYPCVALYNMVFDEMPMRLPSNIELRKIAYKNLVDELVEQDVLQLDDNPKQSYYKMPANVAVVDKANDDIMWSTQNGYSGAYHEIDRIAMLLF